MAKPAPRNNFTQTLLMAAVMILALQLFMGSRNTQPDKRTTEQIHQQLVTAAAAVKQDTAGKIKGDYERKLQEDFDQKKLTQAQLDAKKVEAEVLVADATLKAADRLKDFGTATTGYTTLKDLEKKYGKSDLWTSAVAVAPQKENARTEVTPKQLLAEATETSSRMGHDTPVWGFFPGYQVVDFLVKMTGSQPAFSYAFAGLLLAICVRGAIWKLAQKQLMWSRQMAQLTPLTAELKEKYTGQELQAKIMELYKEYGINPMAGCAPMLIQMPLFLMIYTSMLHYRFEFEKGVFLWVGSGLADRFPGIVARNLGERDYALVVIYGISMVITTLLTPVSDPSNAKQQRLMGLSMSVMFAVMMFFWPIPSAFVLYWIFTNILATAQSLRAYRLPLPPLVKVNAPGGGVYPSNGKPTADRFKNTGAPKVHKPKRAKKK